MNTAWTLQDHYHFIQLVTIYGMYVVAAMGLTCLFTRCSFMYIIDRAAERVRMLADMSQSMTRQRTGKCPLNNDTLISLCRDDRELKRRMEELGRLLKKNTISSKEKMETPSEEKTEFE